VFGSPVATYNTPSVADYTTTAGFWTHNKIAFTYLLTYYLFPVPISQPTATELFQSSLYGSGTVFLSISHLLRHFLSPALAWRHTFSNSVTRNYCCRAHKVTLSFMDTLIALTYSLINCLQNIQTLNSVIRRELRRATVSRYGLYVSKSR